MISAIEVRKMNNAGLYHDVQGAQRLLAKIAKEATERQLSTGRNSVNNHLASPTLKGHVSLDKPNGKFDCMDMKVHLTLKANKKQRSRSLSRPDDKSKTIEQRPGTGKRHQERLNLNSQRWSDILRHNELPDVDSAKNKNNLEDNNVKLKLNDDQHETELQPDVATLKYLLEGLRDKVTPQGM